MNTEANNIPIEEMIELYALGALDDRERAIVEKAVANDALYQRLLRQAQATASALLLTPEPLTPSPKLKQQVFARVDADLAAHAVKPSAFSAWLKQLSNFFRVASPAFAVAGIAIALGMGLWVRNMQTELNAVRSQLNATQQELALLNQPGLQASVIAKSENAPQGAQATLIANKNHAQGVLVAQGMPQLEAGKTFQLWLIKAGSDPVPAGTFNIDADGTGRLIVNAGTPLKDFQQMGITVEPAGGSAAPTLSALMFIGTI